MLSWALLIWKTSIGKHLAFSLRDNPTQKTRVFYTYNHHGNEPLLAAISASGKYGHVYFQLSFQDRHFESRHFEKIL